MVATHHPDTMAKIERLNAGGPVADAPTVTRPAPSLTEFEFQLSDRTPLVFREPTVLDMEQVSGEGGTAIRQAMRLASRCCRKWGKFEGGSLPQFEAARAKDVAAIAEKFNLDGGDPTWIAHDDGNLEIALTNGTTATLRPLLLGDVRITERTKGTDFHQSVVSVARVCLDWGGYGPISMEELRKQPARDFVSVAKIMGEQNRPTEDAPDYEELEDYSKRFTAPSGREIVIRDVTGGDLNWIEEQRTKAEQGKITQADFIAQMVERLCSGWGQESSVTADELAATPMRDVLAIASVVATFR